MKQVITTIAAVLLAGCGTNSEYVGSYMLKSSSDRKFWDAYELKADGTFIIFGQKGFQKELNEIQSFQGTWKIENDLLITERLIGGHRIEHRFNKSTLKHTAQINHFLNDEGTFDKPEKLGSNDMVLVRVEELDEIPITQCKACKGKVSIEAKTCPHCGQPDPV